MFYSGFLHYVSEFQFLAYAIIFLAMIIEGDATLFLAGFLAHLKILDIGDVLAVVITGVLLGDSMWFFVGKMLLKPGSFLYRWVSRATSFIDRHLNTKPFYTIFISKFAYGFNHLVLVRTGMLGRITFGDFIKINLWANLFWVCVIGGLGFFAGKAYLSVKHSIGVAEIWFLAVLVGFILIDRFLISGKIKKSL
jgi:membrane protein DedA with SNARE-associated domain